MKREQNESSTNTTVAIIAVVVLLIGIVATLMVVSPSGEDALEPVTPEGVSKPVPAE